MFQEVEKANRGFGQEEEVFDTEQTFLKNFPYMNTFYTDNKTMKAKKGK